MFFFFSLFNFEKPKTEFSILMLEHMDGKDNELI